VIRSLLGLAAAVASFVALGAGLMLAVGYWRRCGGVARLVVAAFVGAAGASAALPPLVYVGLSPTPAVFAVVTVAALAIGGALARRRPAPPRDLAGGGRTAALVAALPAVVLCVDATWRRPIDIDQWFQWSLKAIFLAHAGGPFAGALDRRVFLGAQYAHIHREYPLGYPALQAYEFHLMGSADLRAIHLHFVLLLLAFATTTWVVLRPHVPGSVLVPCVALLVAAPALQSRALSAYADVPVACQAIAALLFLAVWLRDGERAGLGMAAVLFAGALATKQEGQYLAVVPLALAVVYLLARQRPGLGALAVATAATAATALPWKLWTYRHQLSDSDIAPSIWRTRHNIGTLPTILRAVGAEVVARGWLGAMPLATALAALLLVRRRDRWLAAGYIAASAGLLGAIVLVYLNARVPLVGLLNLSVSRVVIGPQLLALVSLPVLLERSLRRADG